jgi:hypothetical protein
VQADIEKIFGASNVSGEGGWADMDNDNDSTKIANRIAQAIQEADEIIDGRLRGTAYKIPLVTASGGTPTLVTLLSAALAGLWLYDPRGAIDVGDEGVPHALSYWKGWAYGVLDQVTTGGCRLDALIGR